MVIGHVGPEAAAGGPIGLIDNGDDIIVDLNTNELNCSQLADESIYKKRKENWDSVVHKNDGIHPSVGDIDSRLLNRMRCSAVSAVFGAGMHPNREVWVKDPRDVQISKFKPRNKFR